jgi:uncharacterized protein
LDSSAWVALGSSKDQYHKIAKDYFLGLLDQNVALATSDYNLVETFTLLKRGNAGIGKVKAFHEWIEKIKGKELILLNVDDEIFEASWGLYEKYFDQDISYIDCASCVIAREMNADCIFSFDDHFRVMGFEVQPFVEKKGRGKRL